MISLYPYSDWQVLYEISESQNIGTIPKFHAWKIGITMQWVKKNIHKLVVEWKNDFLVNFNVKKGQMFRILLKFKKK